MQSNLIFIIDLLSWLLLQVGNQFSSENAIQSIEDKKFSIASTSQLSSSQNLLKQRHYLDSSSPSNITSESYPEKFSPSGGLLAQRNSKGSIQVKFQMEYFRIVLLNMFVFLVLLWYD